MPQLLVFAPCERVIISGEEVGDGSSSLITILQALNVEVAPDKPSEALVSPMTWFVYVLWKLVPDEIGKAFEQRMELVAPSGELLLNMKSDFTGTKVFQRVVNKIIGLPVSEAGDYQIVLHLAEAGKSSRKIASYPLTVGHIVKEPDRALEKNP